MVQYPCSDNRKETIFRDIRKETTRRARAACDAGHLFCRGIRRSLMGAARSTLEGAARHRRGRARHAALVHRHRLALDDAVVGCGSSPTRLPQGADSGGARLRCPAALALHGIVVRHGRAATADLRRDDGLYRCRRQHPGCHRRESSGAPPHERHARALECRRLRGCRALRHLGRHLLADAAALDHHRGRHHGARDARGFAPSAALRRPC